MAKKTGVSKEKSSAVVKKPNIQTPSYLSGKDGSKVTNADTAIGSASNSFVRDNAVSSKGTTVQRAPAKEATGVIKDGRAVILADGQVDRPLTVGNNATAQPTELEALADQMPTYVAPEAYKSEYSDQIASLITDVANPEAFSYDPLQDVSYQALANIYNNLGNRAARDTLGDAAMLNGGYGSSYATSAAAQTRAQYNQELAAQIPALRQQAYNEYLNSYNMKNTALEALQNVDNTAYGRYRDTVGDSQWQFDTQYGTWRDLVGDAQLNRQYLRDVLESDRAYDYQQRRDQIADKQWWQTFDYQQQRDRVADNQWQQTFDYNKERDQVADNQWWTQYNRSVYENDRDFGYQKQRDKVADKQWKILHGGSSGGGGGGGRSGRSGGGGGYYSSVSSGGSSGGSNSIYNAAQSASTVSNSVNSIINSIFKKR